MQKALWLINPKEAHTYKKKLSWRHWIGKLRWQRIITLSQGLVWRIFFFLILGISGILDILSILDILGAREKPLYNFEFLISEMLWFYHLKFRSRKKIGDGSQKAKKNLRSFNARELNKEASVHFTCSYHISKQISQSRKLLLAIFAAKGNTRSSLEVTRARNFWAWAKLDLFPNSQGEQGD